MSPFSASCLDDISAKLGYLRLGSSHRRWINVIDRNNASVIIGAAPISARMISCDEVGARDSESKSTKETVKWPRERRIKYEALLL